MKRSAAWLGSLAVVLVLGFSGFASADAPADVAAHNLTVSGTAQIAGPLVYYGNYSSIVSEGGPVGIGGVVEGKKCGLVPLDGPSVDASLQGWDRNTLLALITLRSGTPGATVAGYQFINGNSDLVNRMKVCLAKNAPVGGITFSYMIFNTPATG